MADLSSRSLCNLVDDERFSTAYSAGLTSLRTHGVRATVEMPA